MKETQEETQKTKASAAHTSIIPHQGFASSPPLMISLFNPGWHFNGNVPVEAGEHILDYLDVKTLGLTTPRINKAWRTLTEGYLQKHPAIQKEVEEEKVSRKEEIKRKKEEERQSRISFHQLYDTAGKLFEPAKLKTSLLLSLSSTTSFSLTISDPSKQEKKEIEAIVLMLDQVETYLAGKEYELTFKGALQVATKLSKEEMYVAWMQGFELLGDVYQQRGILQQDERQLLKAVTIYNLALCSQERYEEIGSNSSGKKGDVRNSCIAKIKRIEELLIIRYSGNVMIQTIESYWQTTEKAKQALKEIRYRAQLEIFSQERSKNDENNSEDKLEQEGKEISVRDEGGENNSLSIQAIYHHIATEIKEKVIKPLIMVCQASLPIPSDCVYSINFLGSFARSEATPYSDFECAVLLQDQGEEKNKRHKAYMRQLITLLWIKILNLGETTARMMDITSLSWLSEQDSPARKGFSFDGQMEDGCHTPLGNVHHTQKKIQQIDAKQTLTEEEKERERQKVHENEYELIGTPKELASFQEERWVHKRGFSTVLSTVEPIVSNDSQLEKSLTVFYEEEMEKIWDQRLEGNGKTFIQKRSLDFLAESVERFQFRGGRFDKEVHYFDAKYHLYRLPNMVLDHLASYFGVKAKNLWDKIESIFGQEGKIPNQSGARKLREVVSIILQLRLSAYLKKGCRDDHVLMLDLVNPEKNPELLIKYLGIPKEMLFRVYGALIPLQWAAEEFMEEDGLKQALLTGSCFDSSPYIRGKIYYLLLDYEHAIEEYKNEIEIYKQNIATQNYFIHAVTLNELGLVYADNGDYDDALAMYKEAKRVFIKIYGESHIFVGYVWDNLGVTYKAKALYKEALTACEEAKRIFIERCGQNHTSVASVLNNIGVIYKAQGSYGKALAVFEESKRIKIEKYGQDHISVVTTLYNLGTIYYEQSRNYEAITAYAQAKHICIKTFGEHYSMVANIIMELGRIYEKQLDYEKAITAYNEAMRIFIMRHGNDFFYVAQCLYYLGYIYIEQGQFNKGREFYNKAIESSIKLNERDKTLLCYIIPISYIREGNICMLKEPMNIEVAEVCYKQSGYPFTPTQLQTHEILAKEFYNAGSLTAACEHYQILIKLNPTNAFAYHNLACLIHVRARIEKDRRNEAGYRVYLTEAEGYFEKAIELGAHAGIYTEYAQFMLHNHSQYPIFRIVEALQKTIALKQEDRGLNYGVMERSSVDSHLQSLIDEHKEIAFRADLLAYYLLIQTYLINDQLYEAKQIYKAFEVEITEVKQSNEKSEAELVNNMETVIPVLPEGEAQTMLQQLQSQQQALDKEQQLLDSLLTFSQYDIAAYSPFLKQQANNNYTEETIDAEFEAAIKLPLTSPSSKLHEDEFSLEEDALISSRQSLETLTEEEFQADEDAELQAAIVFSLTKTNEEDRNKKNSTELDTPVSFSSEEKPLENAALSNRVGSRTRSPLHSRFSSPPFETMKEVTSQALTQSDERERIKQEIIKHMAVIKELIEPSNIGENIVPSFVEEMVKPQLQYSEEMLVGEYEVDQWQERLIALKACETILKDGQKVSSNKALMKL